MKDPTKLTIELWDFDAIKEYAKNAKKHSVEQVKALAATIRKFGHDQPIVVDGDGVIIKGHGRRLAVKYNHENHATSRKVPVIVRADLTKTEADAARLADNRVSSTEYDLKAMGEELARLQPDIDMVEHAGFTEKEIEFTTPDISDIDENAFVDDISGAVENQKVENTATEKAVDKSETSVGDALGFKKVTIEQSRAIRGFMSKIETQTGKKGIDALITHIGYEAATFA